MIFKLLLSSVTTLVMLFSGSTATRWGRNLCWCYAGSQLFEGDFNGDGKTDLLCHRPSDGYKWITFANSDGHFTGTSWEHAMGWCNHANGELHIGDFNGDGRSDLLCHDTGNGYKWISFANCRGNFAGGTSWEYAMGWCIHANGELHIGDFNGDGRSDLLCHDTGNGYKWISHANSEGNFAGGTRWEREIGWCNHKSSSLHIGDINGDGRDDLICHDGRGYKWVALANCNDFNDGTTWEADLGWCSHSSGEFFIGDYNGDSKADMLCHDSNNGYKWIIYAELTLFQ